MNTNFSSISFIPGMQECLENIFSGRFASGTITPVFATLPPSVELEHLMDGLCDDLEKADAVRFTGDRRWLNFRLDYTEDIHFPSFALMIECMHRHAGYRNEFGGVVRVDITDWCDHADNSKISDVFAFIHDYSDKDLFLVSVNCDDPHMADALKKEMNRWVYTAMVDADEPSVGSLTQIVYNELAGGGHTLTDDAQQLIRDSVETLAKQKHFAGMREILSLSTAILNEAAGIEHISASHLSAFAPNGEWISSFIESEKITIGFSGGNTNGRA